VIQKRLQVIQNAIEYAEIQMNNANKVSKKIAYDGIRLALYDYVLGLDDNHDEGSDLHDIICDIFEDDGFCDDGMMVVEQAQMATDLNTQPTVVENNHNARIYINSVSYDTSNHNISVTTCEA